MLFLYYLYWILSDGRQPCIANCSLARDPHHPQPCHMPLRVVKNIYYRHKHKDTSVCHQRDHLCSFSNSSGPLLWKTTRTAEAYHTEPFPLTINPGYSNAFKECNPQKAHTTGCIVVKELKHIHATLVKEKKESYINYRSDEVERKKATEIEGATIAREGRGAQEVLNQEYWHPTNRGRVQQVLRRHWGMVNC